MPELRIQLCGQIETGLHVQLCNPPETETVGVALCEYKTDCEKLAEAILERQKACGITASWDYTDPTNTAKQIGLMYESYTDANYRAYINLLAPSFIDGLYAGGINAPVMLTNNYANGIEGCADLYALVCDMLSSKLSWTITGKSYTYGKGYVEWSTWAAAKTLAESNWPNGIWAPGNPLPGIWTSGRKGINNIYTAEALISRYNAYISGFSDLLSKTIDFYTKFQVYDLGWGYGVYADNGYSPATNNQNNFSIVLSETFDLVSSATTTERFPSDSHTNFPVWCRDPSYEIFEDASTGWFTNGPYFALINWWFSHV